MRGPPAARPLPTSAEGPAPHTAPEVWAREHSSETGRRITRATADRLVTAGIADRVSAAGHIRLKLGTRFLPNGDAIHGLPAIEKSRFYYGDEKTASAIKHLDRAGHDGG